MQCNVLDATSFLSRQFLRITRPYPYRNLGTSSALHLKVEEAPHPDSPSAWQVPAKAVHHRSSVPLSRAACQAVRLSCNNGRMRDAFYIINSLRYNLSAHPTQGAKIIDSRQLNGGFEPIQFDQPVNPRLSCHALLHGLIRQGLSKKASQLAGLMMQDGVKIRTTTLEALTAALCKEASTAPRRFGPSALLANAWAHTRDLAPRAQNGHLSEAIRLLHQAKQHRQRRTRNMFERLINACLLQGEILVGSLLFVLLVKDWERRRQLALRITTTRSQGGEPPEDLVALYEHMHAESLYPSQSMMNGLLHSIDATFSETTEPDSLHPSLQALANLTYLLDKRQLPFGQIPVLIRTLQRSPRTDHKVWVSNGNDDRPKQVNAYNYFHATLKRLISNLPTMPARNIHFDPRRAATPKLLDGYDSGMLPALDLPSYNALLHYALRHRLSPSMANDILKHMTEGRHKPLQPDISTFNTLLRSATLIQKNSFAESVLDILRAKRENAQHLIMVCSDRSTDPMANKTARCSRTARFSKALQKSTTAVSLPHRVSTDVPLIANERTLSSYILHLVSTGQPETVAEVLFRVLPELKTIDHPTQEPLNSSVDCLPPRQLKRATTYGPYFFTNVLNALRKVGRTGLTERVWLLAKKAERASWKVVDGRLEPWCLPAAAYTIMMQCYADEAKRSTDREHMQNATRFLTRDEPWVPRSKDKVIGWALFARRARVQYRNNRSAVGRHLGLLLFRSMKDAGTRIYESLLRVAKDEELSKLKLDLPQPDARFFNAALGLCALRQNGKVPSRSHYRRRLRFANLAYARSARGHPRWTPALQEVCDAMKAVGYPVPAGLAPLLVGRGGMGECGEDVRPHIDRTPFAYPRTRKGWYAYRLRAEKTRGLPLGRRLVKRCNIVE